MSRQNLAKAMLVWAALITLLFVGWRLAFHYDHTAIRIAGNVIWAVTTVGVGRWFVWIQQLSNRWVCYNCEGKKHRK